MSTPALSETPVRVRCRLAGETVEGIAWSDDRAPGMAMFKRAGFDYAHPISAKSIVEVLPAPRVGAPTEGGNG